MIKTCIEILKSLVFYPQDVDKKDNTLSISTLCLSEVHDRVYRNDFKSTRMDTKYHNQNIGQDDFVHIIGCLKEKDNTMKYLFLDTNIFIYNKEYGIFL